MDEGKIVALKVFHCAAHARKAFAESKVIGRVGLGWLTLFPIPITAILQVHHVGGVTVDDFTPALEAEVVHAA